MLISLSMGKDIFMGDNGIFFTSSILIVALIYEYTVLKTIKYADKVLLKHKCAQTLILVNLIVVSFCLLQ